MATESQVCDSCELELPLDASHFDRKRDSPNGFRSTCKTCRGEQRAAGREDKESNARVKKINLQVDSDALETLEALDPKKGTRVPHIAEMLEAVADAFGGPQGIARHLLANFTAARPGSQQRVRILDRIIRMSDSATREGSATKPVDLMTDEELNEYALEQAKLMMRNNPDVLRGMLASLGQQRTVEGTFTRQFGPVSAEPSPVKKLEAAKAITFDDI